MRRAKKATMICTRLDSYSYISLNSQQRRKKRTICRNQQHITAHRESGIVRRPSPSRRIYNDPKPHPCHFPPGLNFFFPSKNKFPPQRSSHASRAHNVMHTARPMGLSPLTALSSSPDARLPTRPRTGTRAAGSPARCRARARAGPRRASAAASPSGCGRPRGWR